MSCPGRMEVERMGFLALFVCLLGAAILLFMAAGKAEPSTLARVVRYVGGGLMGAVALFLVLTGRVGLALPVGAAALMLARGDLSWLGRFRQTLGQGNQRAGGDEGATGQSGSSHRGRQQSGSSAQMTSDEAYEVLGLRPGASVEDIKRAHRDLMQKVHPDHGGSSYLATKLNQAKDMLMHRARA